MNALRALFASPAALLAGALSALVAALLLAWSARRRAARAAGLVSPDLAAKARFAAAPATPAAAAALSVLVALGLGAALARPHWGDTRERAERRGADVVLVLDTSASMRAADVSPSRFALARQAAQSLLARLGSDRVALVSCEGEAQALVPLTLDAAAVGLFLDAMEPGMGARPGTSLASGIAAAADLFPPGVGGGRHVVFFSDGEDLEGGLEAAIGKAKAEGITIHTVFVGSTSGNGAPVPEVDAAGRTSGYKTDANGQPVLSKANPELLRRLASETGGSFTEVTSLRTDLEGVARQIDLGARRPLSEVLLTLREERFQIPLGIAVAALGLLLLGVGAGRRSAATRAGAGHKRGLLLRRVRGAGVQAPAVLLLLALGFRAAAQSAPALPASASPQQPAPPSSPSQNPPSSSDPATTAAPGAAAPAPDAPLSIPLSKKIFSSPRSSAIKGEEALAGKKTNEALAHFQEEVALDPKDPTGAYNLGTAQSQAGRAPEALASLEKARREGRGALVADAAFNEGQTLFREKQYDQAAAAFREALKSRPGDADAAWNYELCVRRAEEQKKQQEQQKQDQQKKDEKKDQKDKKGAGDQKQQAGNKEDEKRREDREFEQKANMTREKAEQLLSAIERSDLEEQKKKIAEQRSRRKVARDW